jgi:DNA-directed RNA polymerase specialized sigma24 family protein
MPFNIEATDEQHLQKLSKVRRELLVGSQTKGYAELAAEWNMPIGTIKSNISRAKDSLVMLRAEEAERIRKAAMQPVLDEQTS